LGISKSRIYQISSLPVWPFWIKFRDRILFRI